VKSTETVILELFKAKEQNFALYKLLDEVAGSADLDVTLLSLVARGVLEFVYFSSDDWLRSRVARKESKR
jgi:hypothetical protein